MKSLPIYTYGFEVLRKKTKRLTKVDDKLIELVQNMFYTMHKANGIGLAAPQVGLDIALTVIDLSQVREEENHDPLIQYEPIILLNPKVADSSGEIVLEEGCLSFPGLRFDVSRPDKVYIEYQDLDLNKQHIELDGMMARVAQHEIDHLNGILFIDHLNKEIKRKFKEYIDRIKSGEIQTSYILAALPRKKRKQAKSHILDRI
jgi:peptide deformylase